MLNQSQIIKECLNAVVNGPFVPEHDFHTIFGLYRNNVRDIFEKWPNVNMKDESVLLAINNSFNNLLGYPIEYREKWSVYLSLSPEQLEKEFESWRLEVFGKSDKYFDNMM